jgi:hypothetical protein
MSEVVLPTTHGFTRVPLMTHIWISPQKYQKENGCVDYAVSMEEVKPALSLV